MVDETKLLERITFNPAIYGGKAIIRGRRLVSGPRNEQIRVNPRKSAVECPFGGRPLWIPA
jgi:hypothetical protein